MKRGAYIIGGMLLMLGLLSTGPLLLLRPLSTSSVSTTFEIKSGDGFQHIAAKLEEQGLIRSDRVFEAYAFLFGAARHLKPGIYELSPSLSTPAIVARLSRGIDREVVVTIPEGSNIYDIAAALSTAGVLPQGEFLANAKRDGLEGYLFPDTYRFYMQSDFETVRAKFADAFARAIQPLLPPVQKNGNQLKANEIITLASILEKEVPDQHDRQVVAGIFLKRLDAGMPLQADATLCYAKRIRDPAGNCYPVLTLDTKIDSPYNSYQHIGLPPGPIGNPGISAVKAALSPVLSPYWYYLTDPVTKHTIFSKSLSEQEANRSRYLLQSTH
jgi:UPF0755 protein